MVSPRQVGELEEASKTFNMKTISFLAHALKGSAETCFVDEMAKVLARATSTSHRGTPTTPAAGRQAAFDLESFAWRALNGEEELDAALEAHNAVMLLLLVCAESRKLVATVDYLTALPEEDRLEELRRTEGYLDELAGKADAAADAPAPTPEQGAAMLGAATAEILLLRRAREAEHSRPKRPSRPSDDGAPAAAGERRSLDGARRSVDGASSRPSAGAERGYGGCVQRMMELRIHMKETHKAWPGPAVRYLAALPPASNEHRTACRRTSQTAASRASAPLLSWWLTTTRFSGCCCAADSARWATKSSAPRPARRRSPSSATAASCRTCCSWTRTSAPQR